MSRGVPVAAVGRVVSLRMKETTSSEDLAATPTVCLLYAGTPDLWVLVHVWVYMRRSNRVRLVQGVCTYFYQATTISLVLLPSTETG